jgi:hypothetical protein
MQAVRIFGIFSALKNTDGSPVNDVTETHGIYECHHIKGKCMTSTSVLDPHGCYYCEFLSPCRSILSVIVIYF